MSEWIKSSYCAADKPQCVEVRFLGRGLGNGMVHLRDSKCGDTGPHLSFSTEEWQAFVAGVKAGEFD